MSALERLIKEAEQAVAVLLEIELDPTRELLARASLTGTTAERWAAVDAALRDAWAAQTGVEALIERARALGRKRSEELRRLLDEPSIDGVTPEQAVARMRAAGEQARTCLATVAGAWDALVPRLRAINATLRACTELGASPVSEQRALEQLTRLVTCDPLGAHDEAVEALEASVARVHAATESARDFRAQAADRLAAARAQAAEARALEADARAAHAVVRQKIAEPDVPEPRPLPDDLERGLDDVAAQLDADDWSGAHAALEAWNVRTAELVREQRSILAANRAPLDARHELRGLLDAYHAKARALRALEDPALMERFDEAERALHTTPTDLAEAERLVHAYRDGLSEGVRR
jgi:hypothetical protein